MVTAIWIDRASRARGLLATPLRPKDERLVSPRRYVYLSLLVLTLYLGVFQVLSLIGMAQELEFEGIPSWQLFSLHFVFVSFLVSHWLLSSGSQSEEAKTAGASGGQADRVRRWGNELLIGSMAGVGLWAAILVTLLVIGTVWSQVAGESPGEVPPMVEWIGTRPLALRLAIALSAGVVEEVFFRGFLQARIGVLASTLLFVIAHFSYGQPLLILGILLLSLAFSVLVVWRRSVIAAVAAHTVFDAIQLVFVIPAVLGALESGAANPD